MKLIFVASSALATYLVISALSGDMTRNGFSVRRNGLYSSCSTSPTSGRRTPTTTRSGFMKSSIAAPSLRNSGLLATSHSRPVCFLQPGEDLGVGADRHGALGDDDRVRPQVRRDAVDHRPQRRQVGRAVVALRRADGQINDLGRLAPRRPGRS